MSSLSIDWNKVNQPELIFQRFASRRSQIYGTKGVVACSQPLAAEAGLEILRKGGNAGTMSFMSPISIIPLNPEPQPMRL
jgi:gamma-glutamyltranspeptidase/glutathione hydrolase